jgi:hypothetical protein
MLFDCVNLTLSLVIGVLSLANGLTFRLMNGLTFRLMNGLTFLLLSRGKRTVNPSERWYRLVTTLT